MLATFYHIDIYTWDNSKAVENGPFSQVLAGPLFLKVKIPFYKKQVVSACYITIQ